MEINGTPAVTIEGVIERSVGVKAGDGELAVVAEDRIAAAAVVAFAGNDDLPVRLNHDAPGEVTAVTAEVSAGDAVETEGLIDLAVDVQSGDGEVVGQLADDDHLAIFLRDDGRHREADLLGDDLAAVAEGGVEGATAEHLPGFQPLEERR